MIEQRTEAWFQQRKSKITGSNIGAILGCDPFRKPKDVMRSMVRSSLNAESEFTGNIATQYGTKFEPFALADFEMETGLDVIETGFNVSSVYDWLGASPDGLINDDEVLEIKCPFGKRESADFKSLSDQPHYYAQMQIEMLCTGRNKCHFYQWSNVGSKLDIVELSQLWLDENMPKLKSFYNAFLLELKAPEKHLMDLVQTKQSKELADIYNKAKEEIKAATEVLNDAKAKLIKLADGNKSNISGVLVYPIERQGTVQYKNIPELNGVNLDDYRGKSTTSWGVK
jgi:putative phage-type endonuclease